MVWRKNGKHTKILFKSQSWSLSRFLLLLSVYPVSLFWYPRSFWAMQSWANMPLWIRVSCWSSQFHSVDVNITHIAMSTQKWQERLRVSFMTCFFFFFFYMYTYIHFPLYIFFSLNCFRNLKKKIYKYKKVNLYL